jgi:hypothetical protein
MIFYGCFLATICEDVVLLVSLGGDVLHGRFWLNVWWGHT